MFRPPDFNPNQLLSVYIDGGVGLAIHLGCLDVKISAGLPVPRMIVMGPTAVQVLLA